MNEMKYNNSDPTKPTFIKVDKIREELAEYAHKQWSGWMKYLFSKCEYFLNGKMVIPKWAVERWQKQIETSYKDLSEEEKTSDRSEAEGMLNIFKAADLLPTEKVCPECEGEGDICISCGGDCYEGPNRLCEWAGDEGHDCDECEGSGIIPLYYTPKRYEEIMGKPFGDGGLIWCQLYSGEWGIGRYKDYKKAGHIIVIVQTAQSAPDADYQPEE